MSKQLKWTLAILGVVAFYFVARAAVQNSLYFPLIYRAANTLTPTATRTPTVTLTPSVTYTPTPTPTRTRTPTPVPGVFITHIEFKPDDNAMGEYVEIKNQYSESVDMTDWTLKNDHNPPDIFTFPKYTLTAYAKVKVWTKRGTNTVTNLYWQRDDPVWNDHGDCAHLRDEDNEKIDSLCYSGLNFYRP